VIRGLLPDEFVGVGCLGRWLCLLMVALLEDCFMWCVSGWSLLADGGLITGPVHVVCHRRGRWLLCVAVFEGWVVLCVSGKDCGR
jgi:hypothetical protein